MSGDGSAGTAMLGLRGFVLLAESELDGKLEQAVETTEQEVWCRGCCVQGRPRGPAGGAGAGPARGRRSSPLAPLRSAINMAGPSPCATRCSPPIIADCFR